MIDIEAQLAKSLPWNVPGTLNVPLDITKEGLNDDHDEDHQHKRGANHPLEVLR